MSPLTGAAAVSGMRCVLEAGANFADGVIASMMVRARGKTFVSLQAASRNFQLDY
ncbi:hypothetical protein [Mesorhizobium sp. M2A.F.Ca.ET.042.01.1.1]|uniref:hypothetical protein n=1 Tax=Mesorhizobium sp. M2A.F.Ca.ET.042.01.1.1 TaxID=2496745 RepID=UPI001677349B|nr:hypothetical protein [Mesorhizobium sp. M2A.F.Ca.ET.042.01.1.1]